MDLRSRNFEEAARALGRLAEHVPAMRATIYNTAWRAGMPPELISHRVVPRQAEAAGEFLCYLARQGEWEEIVPAYRALSFQKRSEPPAAMLQYVASRLEQAGRDVEGRQFAAAVRQSQVGE